MSFWAELKRRNVFKVGAAYVILGWLIAQVASVFAPALNLPEWTIGFVALLLVLGFPLALFFAWAYELTPDGVRQTSQVPVAQSISRTTGKQLNYLVSILLAAAVVFLVADNYLWTRGENQPSSSDSLESASTQARFPGNSIAVLPFVNMSSDEEQEYFSDGLSEELLNQLAQIDGLSVAGRTSSFAFKGQTADFQTIGDALEVAYVLEGSVRTVGEDLRITAQLIDTTNGYHLWSQTYARKLIDVFAVQEDISLEVARALSIQLGVTGPELRFGGTEHFEAYDLYLRGSALVDSAPDRALDYLRESIAIDPEFPHPWMASTYAYGRVLQASRSFEEERRALDSMEQAALRTVELAPDRWEGQSALLWMFVAKKDWLSAYRAHQQAQEFAARSGVRMDERSYANFLHQIGHVEDALAGNRFRYRADPLNPVASFDLQIDLMLLGRFDEAIAEYERSRDLPGILNAMEWYSIPLFMEQGDEDIVVRLLSANPWLDSLLADVWMSPEEALRALRDVASDEGYYSRAQLQFLPIFAAYYGDSELAVSLLRRAFLGEGYAGFFLIWHPLLSEARQTEEFKRFALDVGFVDLWREMDDWGDYCQPIGLSDFECF